MSVEFFNRQTQLLAATRQTGHRATALDTHNSFEYRKDIGWTQLVPLDGIPGEPIVVSEDRTLSGFDTYNRLVPAGGTAGQAVSIDQYDQTQVLAPIRNIAATTSTAANTTAQIEVVTVTIPGGALGPTGYLRCRVYGQFTNTTGSPKTLQAGDYASVPWTHSATSQSYPTGNGGTLVYTCEIWNDDSESVQQIVDRIDLAKSVSPTDNLPSIGPVGGGGIDTSAAWSYSVGLTMSVASASLSWLVHKILIETYYSG